MKTKFFKFRLISLFLAVGLLVNSCEEDDFPVPEASTQAKFSYEVTIITDGDGNINFEVDFFNESIRAVGFYWDFGNDETSTEENPTVIYTEAGVYDVTLTVDPEVDLHYNNLVHSERVTAVATIFEEGFDDPDLEFNFPPEGWKLIDKDGDGHNWYWGSSEGEYYILSDSWYQPEDEVLTPDNWIITPKIDITDVAGANLEFKVTPRASGPAFRTENYAVLVSTTGTEIEDFEKIYEERLTEDMDNWIWVDRLIDLSDYAGEEIHIAFRHYDSTDLWSIVLTDIHVYETAGK